MNNNPMSKSSGDIADGSSYDDKVTSQALLAYFTEQRLSPENHEIEPPNIVLQGSSSPAPGNALVPPPSPKGPKEETELAPPRRLVGATDEQVKKIEQFLPPGAQIYLSPIGSDESKAAVAEADLDGDGIVETIVVHRVRMPTIREPTPPLSLSVLSASGSASAGRVSVSIGGGVLFNIKLSGRSMPLVVKDLTGDHVPEIVVASGERAWGDCFTCLDSKVLLSWMSSRSKATLFGSLSQVSLQHSRDTRKSLTPIVGTGSDLSCSTHDVAGRQECGQHRCSSRLLKKRKTSLRSTNTHERTLNALA